MGEAGAPYAYCDDSYIITESYKMAEVLAHAPAFFFVKRAYGSD
jgi:hypothetical protein